MEPRLISCGATDRRRIALTFDDGPSRTTPGVLDALDAFGVRATFFMIGSWVEQLPDIVRATAARGHELGNHTWTHVDSDRTRELATLRDEVARTNDVIERVAGRRPALMRPPYGSDPGRLPASPPSAASPRRFCGRCSPSTGRTLTTHARSSRR